MPADEEEQLSSAARLVALEELTARLSENVQRLEARLSALEADRGIALPAVPAPVPGPAPAPLEGSGPPPVGTAGNLVALVGRSFLVLAGAFLIRALADGGTLSGVFGPVAGLAYAAVVLWFADRAAGRGDVLRGSVDGVLSCLIAYPLIVEAATRLKALPSSGAALALILVGAVTLGTAWRRNLVTVAWASSLGTAGAGLLLVVDGGASLLFALTLLAFGIASLWLTYGRRWHGIRWPLALGADLSLVALVLVATRGGEPPEGYGRVVPGQVVALAVALFISYVGSFALRTLRRQRSVNPFEVTQTLLALGIGFGGAVQVARVHEIGAGLLGAGALVLAAAAYVVAFAFVKRVEAWGPNFHFFASLALVLAIVAIPAVAGLPATAICWASLAVLSAGLGRRLGRESLAAHAATYAVAAALGSGLVAAILDAFLAPAGAVRGPFAAASFVTLGAALSGYLLLTLGRERSQATWAVRLSPFALLLIGAGGLGALAVGGLAPSLPVTVEGAPGPAELAALRSLVLASSALLLAAVARFSGQLEPRLLVYPVLALLGLKIFAEDLPVGRAATLTVAFALLGVSLLAAPRLLRRSDPGPASHPEG